MPGGVDRVRRSVAFLIAFPIALLILAVAGCSDPVGKPAGKEVRAAVSPDSPPNLFLDQGRIVGLDLDIFQGYCAARGCRLTLATHDWQGMLGALADGSADVAFSGISITDSRKKLFDFSKSYMNNTWYLVGLEQRGIELESLESLRNYSIGYPRGSVYGAFVRDELERQGHYRLDQVRLYPNDAAVMTDLRNGRLDLAFIDELAVSLQDRETPLRKVWAFPDRDRFGFAFPRGSALRADFDRYLDELGPEALAAMVETWRHGAPETAPTAAGPPRP